MPANHKAVTRALNKSSVEGRFKAMSKPCHILATDIVHPYSLKELVH